MALNWRDGNVYGVFSSRKALPTTTVVGAALRGTKISSNPQQERPDNNEDEAAPGSTRATSTTRPPVPTVPHIVAECTHRFIPWVSSSGLISSGWRVMSSSADFERQARRPMELLTPDCCELSCTSKIVRALPFKKMRVKTAKRDSPPPGLCDAKHAPFIHALTKSARTGTNFILKKRVNV